MSYLIYSDTESLIRKIDECANNPENSSTAKLGENIPCGYTMSRIWTFDHIENKTYFVSWKRLYEKVLWNFKGHAKNIICFGKKKMLTLTKEELESHQDAKVCYICGKRFIKNFANDKNYWKVRGHCHYTDKYRGAAHRIGNLEVNVPNEIPAVFQNH